MSTAVPGTAVTSNFEYSVTLVGPTRRKNHDKSATPCCITSLPTFRILYSECELLSEKYSTIANAIENANGRK